MKLMHLALGAAAVFVVSSSSALAGDLFPPSPSNPLAPWNPAGFPNPDPNTTFNYWHFTQPVPQPETFDSNPHIAPGSITNPDGSTWAPPGSPGGYDGNGTWSIPAGGFMDFFIPNFGPSSGPKFVYIQIKFSGVLPGWSTFDPSGGGTGHHYPGEPVVTPSPVPGFPGISSWSDTLMFDYNPAGEIIHIFNPASQGKCFLDQLVVDTICTPTPGTAGLLVLGGLVAARRRR